VALSAIVKHWQLCSWRGKSAVLYPCLVIAILTVLFLVPSLDPAYFVHRWIFLFLSIIGLRQWLVRIMPQSLVLAVGAGIGLFIA